MVKAAVILAGCGYLDGAEIRESVITLLELDKVGAEVTVFAPDIDQMHVVNHQTGQEVSGEKRNVFVEAARIARGNVKPLASLKASDYEALFLPGGFGVAKNLSNLAVKGAGCEVLPDFKRVINDFLRLKKPIGAICISPAVLAAAVKGSIKTTVTIGDDSDGLIAALGSEHQPCATENCVVDDANKIVSCSAYMRHDSLARIAEGIAKVVKKTLALV